MPTQKQKRPYQIHYQQPATESNPNPSSSDHDHEDAEEKEKPEYVVVRLSEVQKEVQCPICLGVIRKTRTVMECLHRFCRECIDKSMRLGNNECPACRTHCASRRSLRDDPNFDALIAALYPNIDKYEQEVLALCEEEKARNKQIQDTIAQTFRRQAEALIRKRTTTKMTVAAFARRMEDHYGDVNSGGGGQDYRITESEGSDDSDGAKGNGGNDSSSAGEHSKVIPKRHKRLVGARLTSNKGGDKKEIEVTRDSLTASTELISPSERLWGKGGLRSHTRHGSGSAGGGKNSQSSRINKLVQHLQSLKEKDYEMDINLMFVSLDEPTPKMERPYICCCPKSSVKELREHIALRTGMQADEVELYLAAEMELSCIRNPPSIWENPSKDKLQILEDKEILGKLKTSKFMYGHLVLGYQKKQ